MPARHDEGGVFPDYCNSLLFGESAEAAPARHPDVLKQGLRTTSTAFTRTPGPAGGATPSGTQPAADVICSRQQNAIDGSQSHAAATAPYHCRQRHNAGDGLPILLSKDPADQPPVPEQERPRRPSFARKMAEAVARWTYCLIMCGVQPDWARASSAGGPEGRASEKRAGKVCCCGA